MSKYTENNQCGWEFDRHECVLSFDHREVAHECVCGTGWLDLDNGEVILLSNPNKGTIQQQAEKWLEWDRMNNAIVRRVV